MLIIRLLGIKRKPIQNLFVTYYKYCTMKLSSLGRVVCGIALVLFSFSFIHFQDANKDALLISLGAGTCKAGLLNMAIKNNSATKKIDVVIVKKETGGGITSTSTVKYSGLPPGYKQAIGCGGTSAKDSTVIIYSVGAARYSN